MNKQAILAALDFGAYYTAELASLSGQGMQRTAQCPFHDDHREALAVNTKKGNFKCSDCGEKGDIFTFHMMKNGLGFRDALAQLAEQAGLRPEQQQGDGSDDEDINAIIERINEDHFVSQVGGKAYIATEKRNPESGNLELELGSMADFLLLYKNRIVTVEGKKVSIANVWVTSPNRRQYHGIVFAPGKEVPEYYNLWKGYSVEPKQGCCSLFWQHLFFVICRGDYRHYRYVRKWIAHMIQRPAEIPGVAIVIRGSQGTGKGAFADIVGELLGSHYLMLNQMQQLTGRFTGHLKEAILVYANEAVWGGDKHGEGALKSLITDKWCTVESKGKDLYQVRNYKRVIVSSNEQCAVPMAMDDRRFLVLQASDARKEDKQYFSALATQMEMGGYQALIHDLMRENLDGFDVRTKPDSTLGFDIKLLSAEPIVRWWYERLHEGLLSANTNDLIGENDWDREPIKTVLYDRFIEFCKTHRTMAIGMPVFGKQLHKMLPGCSIGETRTGGDVRTRRYTLPSLENCRAAFQRFAKDGPEIWE